MNLFEDAYLKALLENKRNTSNWTIYKEENETLKESLKFFCKYYKPKVMIPIGKKAFMKGHLIHTDEVLVALGDSYFLKSTCRKATEICERRIKDAEDILDKCEKEKNLIESRISVPQFTFADPECKEIIEPFTEEEDKSWRIKHREKERQYKQQLKELKESEKGKLIANEKQLWERLDALELKEELTAELYRLGCSDDDDEDEEEDEEEISGGLDCIEEGRDSDDMSSPEEEENNDKNQIRFENERTIPVRLENKNNQIQASSSRQENANILWSNERNNQAVNVVSETVTERKSQTMLSLLPSSDRPMSRFRSSKK